MVRETKKATVYAYVGHERGVAADIEGNKKRNEWIKLNLELDMDECIEKLSWRTSENSAREVGGWGSNNIVVRKKDLNELMGTVLTYCDAMIGDKEQRDAWKKLLRETIYKWHDTKMYAYNLDLREDSSEDEGNIN